MTNNPTEQPVTVEQVDREAAVAMMSGNAFSKQEILAGKNDTYWLVQAFARHRLAAINEGLRLAADVARNDNDPREDIATAIEALMKGEGA